MAEHSEQAQRVSLPAWLRWGQITLFLLFLADTYTYSILDTLLGRYLGTMGISQFAMSLAYAIYGIFQVAVSILLLFMQCWPAVARPSELAMFITVVITVAAAMASTLLMVIWPASYTMLLVARALQGIFGAIYYVYAMALLAVVFPAEWRMQAVAFMTAGLTFGDSLAPVLGAVLYDVSSIVTAYISQTAIYFMALAALVLLAGLFLLQRRKEASAAVAEGKGAAVAKGEYAAAAAADTAEAGGQRPAAAEINIGARLEYALHEAGSPKDGAGHQQQQLSFKQAVPPQQPSRHVSRSTTLRREQGPPSASKAGSTPLVLTFARSMSIRRAMSGASAVATAPDPAPAGDETAHAAGAGAGGATASLKRAELSRALSTRLPKSATIRCSSGAFNGPGFTFDRTASLAQARADLEAVLGTVQNGTDDRKDSDQDPGAVKAADCLASTSLEGEATIEGEEKEASVWQLLKCGFVIAECMLGFWAQCLRASLDVLTPLAMYTTDTWLVGIVFLGEAAGAVVAPFILDQLLVWFPNTNTRHALLAVMLTMAVSAPAVLLSHLSVAGAFVCIFVFGSAHSCTETLVFNHLVEYVGVESSAVLIAAMSVFSLFYTAGFTVGAFVAGAPSQSHVAEQQLAVAGVAAAMVVFGVVHTMLLRKGWISTKPMS